jgi:acetyl esterase/lipase
MTFAAMLVAASVTVTTTIDGGVIQAQTPAPAQARPNPNAEPETVLLWPDGAPGALGKDDGDRPTLTIYRARQPSGASVIVAPGGGYSALASNHEGRQVANLLNAAGVTAFVLKYRLGPRYRHPIELGDAQRAIRLVRARAQELGLAADRIGMMGFSAGGHLAATAGTHFDPGQADSTDPIERASSRPDFLILAYPVVSFDPAIAHGGSVRNLLGENPDPKLIDDLSNDLRVTPQTPPTFLFHTNADTGVVAEHSVRFYLALRRAKVPAEMHIFEQGPHGVGLALGDPSLGAWPGLLTTWLRARGLTK